MTPLSATRRIALALAVAASTPATATAASVPEPAYRATLARAAALRDRLAGRVGELHARLRAKLLAEAPELVQRLEPEAPAPQPQGHGLLPRVTADREPEASPRSSETRYALAELLAWIDRELARAAELEAEIQEPRRPLEALIDSQALRSENFRRIDQHVAHHAFWQEVAHAPGADLGQATLALYRAAQEPGHEPAVSRSALERRLLGFTPSSAIRLERLPGSDCALVLPLSTDITDEAFLAALREAVERIWNDAPAMRRAGLRIQLELTQLDEAGLGPGPPLTHGSPVDAARHRSRFPEGPVLTSGARTTHVQGGTLWLGPAPLSYRVLAHELGHLLGFHDAYLRAYEGQSGDPMGYTIVEIVPFPGSLMASPSDGQVSEATVERLLEAYAGD